VRRKPYSTEEYVMAFPATLLRKTGYFQGLSFEIEKYIKAILEQKNYMFIQRKDAEVDPNYKQLIPYAILRCGDSIFSYRRGRLLTEERLFGNYSIGIGGHISVNDPTLFGTVYEEGLRREVSEEVEIGCRYDENLVALINDDSSDVSRVHFGIVHVFTLDGSSVRAKEKSINETSFVSISELKKHIHRFEDWSKICINEIERLFSQS